MNNLKGVLRLTTVNVFICWVGLYMDGWMSNPRTEGDQKTNILDLSGNLGSIR